MHRFWLCWQEASKEMEWSAKYYRRMWLNAFSHHRHRHTLTQDTNAFRWNGLRCISDAFANTQRNKTQKWDEKLTKEHTHSNCSRYYDETTVICRKRMQKTKKNENHLEIIDSKLKNGSHRMRSKESEWEASQQGTRRLSIRAAVFHLRVKIKYNMHNSA